MFIHLLKFEIKDRLFRLSSLIYFFVYLALSFLLGITFAGAFKGASVSFGLSNKLALNSPLVISYLTCFIGYIGLLVTAPIFGQSINKDFENKFSQILFATPLSKFNYFFSRFLGSAIASLAILTSIALGIWLASLMPFVDQTLVGPNHLAFYLMPYFTNVIPNTLIFGAIFIALVSVFKKMAPVYIASVAVFTGWLISQQIISDLDNKRLAALIEPFGLQATHQVTQYWSIAEQSSQMVPLTGVFLYNRLIWLGIGLLIFIAAYLNFNPFQMPKEKKKKNEVLEAKSSFTDLKDELAEVTLKPHSSDVFLGLARSEFKQAFTNIYFMIILLCGVLYIFSVSGNLNKWYGTETLPVTYQVLEVIGGTFGLFVVILTTFYAGELVWKEREQRFYELVDSKPVSNLNLYLSKLLALFSIQVFLSMVVLVCCVIIQVAKGYTHFEWSVYFESIFLYSLSGYLLNSVLILFVQTISPNKYVGHAIVILYYIGLIWLPSLGFDHKLYLVGEIPFAPYSDLNHFGTSAGKALVFGVYWLFFHLGLAVLSILFWNRGALQPFSKRFQEAKRRFQGGYRALLVACGFGFVAMGAFIFYNTNILNPYLTQSETEQQQVDMEKTYSHFKNAPHLQATSVKVAVDLFPETQSMRAHGTYAYENKSGKPISEIFMSLDPKLKDIDLKWSVPSTLSKNDERLHVRVYAFDPPIAPGKTVQIEMTDAISPKGFTNEEFSKEVLQNGTFLYGWNFSPVLDYQDGGEITEDKVRRKYHLPDRLRVPLVDDVEGLKHNELTDADWINFEATVSTSADQIAVAPGYLVKDWSENGRHYFHYQMDRPILNFYAFLSARYVVDRSEWKGVKIEIYHHPDHGADVARMIESVKASLTYYTENFSPYQFKQVRIFEFPRYASFAQSFPNTIPFSEAIGFIAKIDDHDPESIDYPFYVTAHEVAHQWWGHQVIDARVQGVAVLVESLAQYSALMVQQKRYGPKQMKKFLRYELDRYLQARSRETKKELPLELSEGQNYLHYQKGSLVFYALQDYLGEARVNGVLKNFLKEHAFKGAPYPRAIDLVEEFKKVTPPELQYVIHDLFETITFYDNRAESVTYHKENDKYKVTIKAQSRKVRDDELGKETEVPMDDLIDVGLLDKDGVPFYLQKHKLHSGENTIELVVDQEPYQGGIDPINKLIDRVPSDNVMKAVEVK